MPLILANQEKKSSSTERRPWERPVNKEENNTFATTKPKQSLFGKYFDYTKAAPMEFIKGQVKGAASTALSLGELGSGAMEWGYNKTIGKLTGREALKGSEQAQKMKESDLLERKNLAQKAGFLSEQIGEFFIPTPGKAVATEKLAIGAKEIPYAGRAFEIGGKALLEGTEQATRVTAQKGEIEGAGQEFAIGAAFPIAGEAFSVLKKSFPKIADAVQRSTLKLSPAQKEAFGNKINNAVDFIKNNKILGNPNKRYSQTKAIINEKEQALDQFLTNSDRTVNKQKVIDELYELKNTFKTERDRIALERQVDDAIKNLETWPDEIPVKDLNQFKRSTYQNAYNKTGTKVTDWVEHDIGDVVRKNIEEATDGLVLNGQNIGDFNRDYGKALEALKLLKIARNKPQTGKLATMSVSGLLGMAFGGPVGAAIGVIANQPIAERLVGTAARGRVAQILNSLSESQLDSLEPLLKGLIGQKEKLD